MSLEVKMEVGPKAEMVVGEQPIEAGANAKMETKTGGQPVKEGVVGPKEEARADDQMIKECLYPCKAQLKSLQK